MSEKYMVGTVLHVSDYRLNFAPREDVKNSVSIQIHFNHIEACKKAFNEKKLLKIKVNTKNDPLSLDKYSNLEMLIGPKIKPRLFELGLLKDGWYDGYGKGFDPVFLKVAEYSIWEILEQTDFPPCYIYPTPEGNVLLEWDGPNDGARAGELEISNKNGILSFYGMLYNGLEDIQTSEIREMIDWLNKINWKA